MTETLLLSPCPCGSQKKFSECCEPLISGQKNAESPEALMRSRYTAFTLTDIDYLFSTMTSKMTTQTDREDMQDFAEEVSAWLGLDIVSAPEVTADATEGSIEFAAHFELDGEKQHIHEQSQFVKIDGQWLYDGHQHQCSSHDHDDNEDEDEHEHHHVHGEHCNHDHHDHEHHHVHGEHCNHDHGHEHHHQQPYIAEEKTGRNDPCSCGSGKKFKKCCIE